MTRKKFRIKLAKHIRKIMGESWAVSHILAKRIVKNHSFPFSTRSTLLPYHMLDYKYRHDFDYCFFCEYSCDDCERGNWCGRL